jgi:hypothetical protein
MAVRGMYIANHDRKNCRVTVVGDASVFPRCVEEMARRLSLTKGWMRVPDPRANGALIGERGAQINALKASSGCTSAQNHGRGTVDWDLDGPAPANIEAFVRLAQEIVPGTAGGVAETAAATVTDLNGRRPAADPLAYPWTDFPERSPRIEVRADLGQGIPGDLPEDHEKPENAQQAPISVTDNLFRKTVATFRAGRPAIVDLTLADDLPAECTLAFLAGLASSQPGARLEDAGAAGIRLTPAASGEPAKPKPTGDVRRYSIQRAGNALHAPTTMLLMGDAIVVDLSQAAAEEEGQVTYYFAGLSAGLGVSFRQSGTHTLAVG